MKGKKSYDDNRILYKAVASFLGSMCALLILN